MIPQPNNPFSTDEYLDFLNTYHEMYNKEKQSSGFELLYQLKAFEYEYLDRLPVYVLARCPYCNAKLWEGIDTLSLNGPGWRHKGVRGDGWYGRRPINPDDRHSPSRPSAHISCNHFHCLDFCVNLNSEIPVEVHRFRQHADIPRILMVPMSYSGTKAVMHSLPIQRVDAGKAIRSFTVYFTTYFVSEPEVNDAIGAAWELDERVDDILLKGPRDYNLGNWLPTGNLYWLTGNENEPELKNTPPDEFPYGNIQGKPAEFWIEDGKVRRYEPFWKKLFGWIRHNS